MSEDSFEVSPQQEREWLVEPQGPSGRVQFRVLLTGAVQADALARALQSVVERHEILRTTFSRQPGVRVPLQVIHDELSPLWRTADLSSVPAEQREQALTDAAADEIRAPLDLTAGPVLRALLVTVDDDRRVLILTTSPLHAGVSSVAPLIDELRCHYAGTGELTEDPLQYADFAAWQAGTIASDEPPAPEARAYWADFWGDLSPVLPFTHEASGAFVPETMSLELDAELVAGLEAQARTLGSSTRSIAQAAWQAALGHAGGEETVAIAVVESDLRHADLVGALGAFSRPLPARMTVAPDTRLAEVAASVDAARREHAQWGDYALAELGGNLEIGFVAVAGYAEQAGEVEFALDNVVTSGPQFRLWVTCLHQTGQLRITLSFDPRHIDAPAVGRLADTLERALRAFADGPQRTLAEVDLLDPGERRRLLEEFAGPRRELTGQPVHDLIAAHAAASPDRTAVVDEHGSLTYAELEARANQLAHRLRRTGVGPDVTVGLCMERTADMVVGLLGILRAGGAYVPLHPEHPALRLAMQLEAAHARALVTSANLLDRLASFEGDVIVTDADRAALDGEPTDAPEVQVSPDHLVYVIYTSGSTGTPKGVGVTHRNLTNYATDIADRLGAAVAPLSFGLITSITTDLGNTSVFGALCSGGTLVLLSAQAASDPAALAQTLARTPVDVLKITPSHAGALLAAGDDRVLPRRVLVLGGERAPWDLVARIRERSSVAILNHYGPTEATVGCCTHPVPDLPGPLAPASVPIGAPIANTSCYILDDRGRLVPIGLAGTLHVAGAGVARGYVGDPELTRERFIADPFATVGDTDADQPARMYDTGDRARWLTDGTIEFLGRADEQVKVRGYRVEPGEIEGALRAHPAVREAVVVATSPAAEVRLVAYYVPGATVAANELRGHLEQRLPEYMIPSALAQVDAIPRTPSGKVDRRALPDPETLLESQGPAYVAPRNAIEEAVAALWAEIIGVDRVGAQDDFFELGGHSLLATQVIAQLRADFLVDLPLHALFVAPTVEALSAEIAQLLEEEAERTDEAVDLVDRR